MPQNVFVWGTSGTGKTLILTQILGMKRSYYRKLGSGINLNIFVTSWKSLDYKSQLLKDLKDNYLTHLNILEGVRFLSMIELCSGTDLFCPEQSLNLF